MIASKCGRQSEHGSNDGTQDQRSGHGERDLSGRQGHAAGGDGNNERAEHAGAAVEGQNAGGANLDIISKRGGVAAMQLRLGGVGSEQSGAHAPPNFQTGMPSRFALSARLSWIPVPGKCITPIGSSSSKASLRLKGAALACFVQ